MFMYVAVMTDWSTGVRAWTAYRLNLADNLYYFDQSRLPVTDILSVVSSTDTDILEIADISAFYRYISGGDHRNI